MYLFCEFGGVELLCSKLSGKSKLTRPVRSLGIAGSPDGARNKLQFLLMVEWGEDSLVYGMCKSYICPPLHGREPATRMLGSGALRLEHPF